MMTRRQLVLAIVAALLICCPAFAEEARIRIVFFTPQDVSPPENVERRMKEIVDYGQHFYGHWLGRWGYEAEGVLPIDRDERGNPIVYFVRGTETAASGKYDNVGFQGAVREQAISQYGVPRSGSTWWIFVYGTQLRASRGWGGYADDRGNGIALLVWNDVAGALTTSVPLAGGVADTLNLKGYLHELGHTMSLPHIAACDKHRLGMSLMGPSARAYRRAKSSREERVYITPAVAALIWKQPQMTGRYDSKPKLPSIRVPGFKAEYDSRGKRFLLSGRLQADLPAHSIVAIDIPEKGPGDYWKKAYASHLADDGAFKLPIDELLPSSGVLKVVFCFDNGVFTGNGKGIGFAHAAEIPYQLVGSNYRIGK